MIKQWIVYRQMKRAILAKNDQIYLRIRRNDKRIERLTKVDKDVFKSEIAELKEENKLLQSKLDI